MPYKDPKKQIENYKRLRTERRAAWIAENGPCNYCGSDIDLQVDHIDPNTKEHQIGRIWVRRESVRLAELAKCQVLCRECHEEKNWQAMVRLCWKPAEHSRRKCNCSGRINQY